jgi:ribonuclease BN (tRNA processing enzyme)
MPLVAADGCSGGRLQTCILLDTENTRFLIDCGTTALIVKRRFGVDSNSISAIVLAHLPGDHFGGIPFLVLDGQVISKRTTLLLIAGPPGTDERLSQVGRSRRSMGSPHTTP